MWALATIILVGGLAVGWVCAWLVHRYSEAADDAVAVLGDVRCEGCHHELLPGPTAARGGHCPECGQGVPGSWWFVTLAVPAAGLGMLVALGQTWWLIPYLWLVPVLVVAAVTDVRLMLIPKRVAWVGFGVGLALIGAVAVGSDKVGTIESALLGAAIYFGFLFLAWLVTPRGMGFGDVRLAAVLGLYLGLLDPILTMIGLFIACVLGVVLGVGYRIVRRDSDRFFPFGPGLALGALIAIWFYQPLLGVTA
jgi:leader peptidase (prepilin peptidase)/N-methyltransferase